MLLPLQSADGVTPARQLGLRPFTASRYTGVVSMVVSTYLSSGALTCYSMSYAESTPVLIISATYADRAGRPRFLKTPCQGEGRGFETRVPL